MVVVADMVMVTVIPLHHMMMTEVDGFVVGAGVVFIVVGAVVVGPGVARPGVVGPPGSTHKFPLYFYHFLLLPNAAYFIPPNLYNIIFIFNP